MAVETRYIVVRNGEEMKTFMDKKQADQYDQMLDRADALAALIPGSPVELSEEQIESLSIFLAENKEQVLIALGAKKAPAPKKPKAVATETDKKKAA